MSELVAGVDVGGTFTDIVLFDARRGELAVGKVPSTPSNQSEGIVHGLQTVLPDLSGLAKLVHGTTVATNTMLQGNGATVALVTTAGFRDVLEIGRTRRMLPSLYDTTFTRPPPLVPRPLRFEVAERLGADGAVLTPLDEAGVERAAKAIRDAGAESVAVCFLHSYRDAAHELRAKELLRRALPEAWITASAEVVPEFREYERFSTAVINAYLLPVMDRYMAALGARLAAHGYRGSVYTMSSGGGIMDLDTARAIPVRTILSGPAGGVTGAIWMARAAGLRNVITCDMGGTSTDVCLIEDLNAASVNETAFAGYPIKGREVAISTVGAGGGSVAHVVAGGALQVGPRSAGADPGPACYGRGGVEPTVTDANVVLGYMPAGTVADGQIAISAELAEAAVLRVAEPLGLTLLEAASGIHRIANARMTRALRSVSSEKGRDPREFALVAYGGAGPIHAAGLADDLGVRTVLVPPVAGLFSAVGLLFARPEFHEVRTCHLDVDVVDPAVVAALFAEMEAKLAHDLEGRSGVEWVRTADLRYGGQSWEVEVGFPGGAIDAGVLAALRARFEDEHERLYGVKDQAGSPVEIRALRLAALGELATTRSFHLDGADTAGSAGSSRRIHVGSEPLDAPVRTRASLGDTPEPGPLLVDEYDTTVLVPPGWSVRRDASTGTLVLERGADGG